MIIKLPKETCCNPGCKQKLLNGYNIGGWKAHRTIKANYESGYQCKSCTTQSIPTTKKLHAWQQNNYYCTNNQERYTVTNKAIQHQRQWNNLLTNIQQEEEKEEATNTPKQMPSWNAVLGRMQKTQLQKNDNISNKMKKYWNKRRKKEAKKE